MDLETRNKEILEFFQSRGIESVKCIGNIATPAVIMHETTVVSCHAHESHLYFTDKPKNGKIVLDVDLSKDNPLQREELLEILSSCEHRKCYRIKLVGGDIYNTLNKHFQERDLLLTGYYRHVKTGVKTPLFNTGDVKLYFEETQAEDAVKKIKNNHNNLILNII